MLLQKKLFQTDSNLPQRAISIVSKLEIRISSVVVFIGYVEAADSQAIEIRRLMISKNYQIKFI